MSFYGFAQNFGNVLGITMGGVILQNDLPQRLPSRLVEQFDFKGDTYSLIPAIATLNEKSQEEVKTAVTNSLRVVWIACVVVCGLGLFVSLWVRCFTIPRAP